MGLPLHRAVELSDPSRVGEVRRLAVQLADEAGFDDVAAGRVAIVATELGNNLLRHASGGRLLVAIVHGDDGEPLLEMISVDQGPGMADVEACMADGYSTGGTPGTGLGSVRRLSREFDVHSAVPSGTILMCRIAAQAGPVPPRAQAGGIDVGAIRLAAPGETVCGDNGAVLQADGMARAFMADGLGHGPDAREAADAAVAVFADAAGAPSQVLERVHGVLRSTRGAAVAMATLDAEAGTVTFSGAGNIAGRIVSGVTDRSLMSQHGTAGVQIRRLQDVAYDWPPHALVVLHSDGIASRWKFDESPSLVQRHPSVVSAWLVREHLRGRDDASVIVLKRREGTWN